LRAMFGYCRRRHLEAHGDEHVREVLRDHLGREQSAVSLDEERVRETVAAHVYDLEYEEFTLAAPVPTRRSERSLT
jgi:hypothetical protein